MSTQASGNVSQDDVTVIELDRERRTRKNLLDTSDYLKRGFLNILLRSRFGHAHSISTFSIANSDG